MTLTISNTIVDEEFRTLNPSPTFLEQDDDDKSPISSVLAGLTFVNGGPNFPQYAENVGFVTSDKTVTNYFLSGTDAGSGPPTALNGVATTLKVGANTVFLYSTGNNEDLVVGRVGTGNTPNASGDVALVIYVQENRTGTTLNSADLWVGLYAPLVHADGTKIDSLDTLNLDDKVFLGSSFTVATETPFNNFAGVPSGSVDFVVVRPDDLGDPDLLITGFEGEIPHTIVKSQASQGGAIGTGAQHTEPNHSIRVDIVNGADFSKADTQPEVKDVTNIDYGAHQDAVAAGFTLVQVNPGTVGVATSVKVFAYDVVGDAEGAAFPTNAIADDGDPVTILPANVRIFNASGTEVTPATGQITAVSDGDGGTGVLITGLLDDWSVRFSTPGDTFDRFIITNAQPTKGQGSNVTFDVGAFRVTTLTSGTGNEFADVGEKIILEDDGPTIPAGTGDVDLTISEILLPNSGSADFSTLFGTPDYGADGPATTNSLTFDILTDELAPPNSGLIDTATNNPIFLFLEDNTDTAFVGDHKVVGYAVSNPADPVGTKGPKVFTIAAVPETGELSLDQIRAVKHAINDPNNPDDDKVSFTTDQLVLLKATVTDSDGDKGSATIPIGTSFAITDAVPDIDPSPDPTNFPNNLVVGNRTTAAPPGFFGPSDNSSFVLTPGDDGLGSYTIVGPADTTGDFRWAYFDVDGLNGIELNEIRGTYKGNPLYTLELANDGSYVFNMIGTIPSSDLFLDSNDIKAGAPNTNSIDVGTLNSDNFVTLAAVGGPVNESNGFVGVSNGNLDPGEGLTINLNEADGDDIPFNGISIGTKSAQASVYTYTAQKVGGGVLTGTESVGKNGTILINSTDLQGFQVTSVTVQKQSGPATKIGLGDIAILLPPADVTLSFSVRETDGDGDSVDAPFTVSIDGNNDGSITNPIVGSGVQSFSDPTPLSVALDPGLGWAV